MWTVLKEASEQPGVVVTVYVDGDKADAIKVKAQLPRATIYRSAELPSGQRVVSHAKFIVIDHEVLLLTSANFSFSAENRNVEFGASPRRTRRWVGGGTAGGRRAYGPGAGPGEEDGRGGGGREAPEDRLARQRP